MTQVQPEGIAVRAPRDSLPNSISIAIISPRPSSNDPTRSFQVGKEEAVLSAIDSVIESLN